VSGASSLAAFLRARGSGASSLNNLDSQVTARARRSTGSRALLPLTAGLITAFALLLVAPSSGLASEPCPNEALREEQHVTALPDCRAYEMVTPPAKNGGDVMPDTGRTRVAVSGDAVSFASLTSFGDALGAGIGTDYVSQRQGLTGTSGWSTHSIEPPRDALSFAAAIQGMDAKYVGEFSDDLSHAVVSSYTPLTNAPAVANVSNLFVRTNALSSDPGSYELLSDCPACGSPLSDTVGLYRPRIAAATPDLGDIIFEATRNLTADAPAQPFFCTFVGVNCQPRLYEWDHGTLRLAGILPDGSAAVRSIAGAGATQSRYTIGTLSNDGSRVFFTVPSSASGLDGPLYMRVDHASTIQLNASERTDCADNNPCTGAPEPDPNGPQPGNFQTASADGSKVFFTSDEQLTDAPLTGLYMYDASLPDSAPHNLTAIGGAANGVVGASEDGSYVYFIAQALLLPGQPAFPPENVFGIYAWHDGTLTFVGSLPDPGNNLLGAFTIWSIRPRTARVTPDGKSLLFLADSGIGLTGFDQGNHCGRQANAACADVYLYRAVDDSLTCVSCNFGGPPATTDATFAISTGLSASGSSTHINRAISDDGNRVFFETGERLVPEDMNGKKSDVYEYDVPTGTLHLITPGTSKDDSHFLEASRDGNNVFFTTNQRLVGWDTDNNYDLYDARVGGGFPEPAAAKPECTGDSCQGIVSTPPSTFAPKSQSFLTGGDNVVPSVRKVVVKPLTKAQKLARALRKCKSKRKRVQRKKCEASARKSFGRGK
jgi:hypothetical protein